MVDTHWIDEKEYHSHKMALLIVEKEKFVLNLPNSAVELEQSVPHYLKRFYDNGQALNKNCFMQWTEECKVLVSMHLSAC